jgi:hypothetical protein
MKPATRWILILVGHVCVLVGLIGAFVPLLPTTPFLLLAAACYLRSSERYYRWLAENRLFGPVIRDYERKRAVSVRTKVIALTLLWASLLYSIHRTDKRAVEWVIVSMGLLLSVMILRLRTLREDDRNRTVREDG